MQAVARLAVGSLKDEFALTGVFLSPNAATVSVCVVGETTVVHKRVRGVGAMLMLLVKSRDSSGAVPRTLVRSDLQCCGSMRP
jgi:hypothetical protein